MKIAIFTVCSLAEINENEKKNYQKTHKIFTIKLVRFTHNCNNGTME